MSKISSKQRKVIEFIRGQLIDWEYSNDIYSPTHYGDIISSLQSMDLEETLTEEEMTILDNRIGFLLSFIQSLDRGVER